MSKAVCEQYKIGDLVQIISEEEVKTSPSIEFGFTWQMYKFCNKTFKIRAMEPYCFSTRYYFENMPKEMTLWIWSADMFHLALTEPNEQEVFVLLK